MSIEHDGSVLGTADLTKYITTTAGYCLHKPVYIYENVDETSHERAQKKVIVKYVQNSVF